MQAREYRPVILKVLQAGGKAPSLEALVDTIIDRMTVYEEMRDLLIGSMRGSQDAAQQQQQGGILAGFNAINSAGIANPQQPYPIDQDVSERILSRSTKREYTEGEIEDMKITAHERYRVALPVDIEVALPGFPHPVLMKRYAIQVSQPKMPFLKVIYAPPGAESDFQRAVISVNVQENIPHPEEIVAEVHKIVKAIFKSPGGAKVEPHISPRYAPLGSEAGLTAGPDADNGPASSEALQPYKSASTINLQDIVRG